MENKERSVFLAVIAELAGILKDVAVGFVSIPFVTYSNKPKWCQCNKCGKWHSLAP